MTKRDATKRQAKTDGEAEQFDRFEQLTRRLLTVPKQEADKERAKKNGKKDR